MSFLETSIIQYVDCIDLHNTVYRATWRRHTNRRVELASMLAECVTCSNKALRRCSRSITRNYRRLEDYAKATGIVERIGTEWVGYGKLVEYTVYFTYKPRSDDKKKQRNARRVEVRVYIPVPLHFLSYNLLWYVAEAIAVDLMEVYYPELLYFADRFKEGYRLVMSDMISPYENGINGEWCNGVARVRLDTNIWAESVAYKIYPYPRIYGNKLEYESDITWCNISP